MFFNELYFIKYWEESVINTDISAVKTWLNNAPKQPEVINPYKN